MSMHVETDLKILKQESDDCHAESSNNCNRECLTHDQFLKICAMLKTEEAFMPNAVSVPVIDLDLIKGVDR